jgi:stress response protein YsnF
MTDESTKRERQAPAHVAGRRTTLPIEAVLQRTVDGPLRNWSLRLPVRIERVTVTKPVMVKEQVEVRVDPTDHMVSIQSDTRKERLRLEVDGNPRVVRQPTVG